MVTIPGFLLRRLYVKGSLQNTETGVSFQLKNSLGSGYAKGMMPVALNGVEFPMEDTFFSMDGTETAFSEVSDERRFTIAMNKTITINVKGAQLERGQHRIALGFVVPGLGQLGFDVKDRIEE